MVNKKIIRGPLLLYLLFLSLSVSRIPIIILYPNLSNPKLSISISVHANTKRLPIFLTSNLKKSFSFSFSVQLLSSLGAVALVSLLGYFGFRFRGSKTKKKHFGSCWSTLLLLLFAISSSLK